MTIFKCPHCQVSEVLENDVQLEQLPRPSFQLKAPPHNPAQG